MIETYLDRAKSNLKAAKYNIKSKSDDEFFLNLSGYLTQQSLEFALKYVLQMYGIEYQRTHNINMLLKQLPNELAYLAEPYEFIGDTLTNWEANSRYVMNYFLERKKIVKVISIVECTITQIVNLRLDNQVKQTEEF